MNKIIISLFILLATGCSSPPKPVPFPEKGDKNFTPLMFEQNKTNISQNSADKGGWKYIMVSHNNKISDAEHYKFWYLAQNASDIELSGKNEYIQAMKLYLTAHGVTANIYLKPVATLSKDKEISFVFTKYHENRSVK